MRIKLFFLLLFSSFIFSQIPAYYSSVDFNQTGNALKNQLATLITNTHTNFLSYTPGVWDALKQTDLNPNDNSKVFLIYGFNDFNASVIDDRNRGVNNNGGNVGDWNREHCYPRSLGNPDLGSTGPGSDAHHLRAADVQFNGNRGNRPYADGEGDAGTVGVNWYPGDEWKGDIARMMMYMYVRYGNQCLATVVGAGPTTYSGDMPDIFLEWNEEDPVNFYEMNRNNLLESIQGNRNPFIDNPYLATLIWGGPQAADSWNTLSCPLSTTWNGFAWNNGTPNKGVRAIINGNYLSSGNLECCSLDIIGSSQVTLQSNHTFTVVRAVNVAPTSNFTIENNANLIQINNTTNTGNITYIKNSSPIIRLDYTAWSSPVSGQNLLSFSPNTVSNRFYEYITSGTNSLTAYSPVNPATTNFLPAKGYIIRAPNNWSTITPSSYIGQFSGTPNNGNYEVSVNSGFSLVGNPYPASIEGSHFIASNRTIETLYFWTHEAPQNGSYVAQTNFASYTTLGGVAAIAGGQIPDGSIKPGQGFYINSGENETILFHNALRYDVKNSQFFRSNSPLNVTNDKFRLNLHENEIPGNQILIGYSSNSSIKFDRGIDGLLFDNTRSVIYTQIDNKKYVINGRGVFDDTDSFNIGFDAKNDGNFTIGLANKEGVFNDRSIYLKDNFTNNIIDLTHENYNFESQKGEFVNRFEIIYSKENYSPISDFIVSSSDNSIYLSSYNGMFSDVKIYDITGKLIHHETTKNSLLTIDRITKSNSVLLISIVFENGETKVKKIIH